MEKELSARQLKYEPLSEVQAAAITFFQNWTEEQKKVFLDSFRSVEPGHLNAYRLCVLAASFPTQLMKGDTVISQSEILFSRHAYGDKWTNEIMEMRDRLLLHVTPPTNLLKKASKYLTQPNVL